MGAKLTPRARAFGERVAHAQDALRKESSAVAAARARWLQSGELPFVIPFTRTRIFIMRLRPWGGLALAIGMVALGATNIGRKAPAPLTFEVGPRESSRAAEPPVAGVVGQWVTAPPEEAMPIRFSDGSLIQLRGAGRGRVVEVARYGARVVLERGTAHANIAHGQTTRWKVDAGPFEVNVVGTVFEVAWEPHAELFTVRLEQGTVTVSGCSLPQERVVIAGETFRAVCHNGRVELPEGAGLAKPFSMSDEGTEPLTNAPPAPVAPLATAAVERAAARSSGQSGEAPPPRLDAPPSAHLRELISAGHYAEALETARAQGLANACAAAPAPDLLSLADAARFSDRSDDADFILMRLRDRFPSDDLASVAAFDLGRIAFDSRHSYLDAARWFDTYLKERPSGALAREASGRVLEAVERGGDQARARLLAGRYLLTFPNGPHANLARSILQR